MKTTSDISVVLRDHMGDDLNTVNVARVSFDKESEWENRERTAWEDHAVLGLIPFTESFKTLSEKDRRLIAYLAKHDHWSPFAHNFVSFRIKAPIFVARQLGKHQVGLVWNEISRRYVDYEPEFFLPGVHDWRPRAENVKQGSGPVGHLKKIDTGYRYDDPNIIIPDVYEIALDTYNALLEAGYCPEQARMVLPQSMMIEWIWSGSFLAFVRVCRQRLDPHAQLETRWVAEEIATHLAQLWPVSWSELMKIEKEN